MKLSKIFVLASAVMAFTACSEEEEWNSTSTGVVSMGQQTVTVKESKGRFVVPVTVTGERNAPVQVTVEVVAAETNPATEDQNYLITSKTINIAADAEAGEVEILTVDDDDINEARQFTMTIISAKGAKIDENNKSTAVTLKDNDAAFYEKLAGKWTMTGVAANGSALSWNVNVIAADEESEDYEKYLYVTGMMGYSWTMAKLTYNYDMATAEGTVTFEMGQLFAEGVNFSGLGVCDVYLYAVEGNYFTTTPIVGTWSDDFKKITFQQTPFIYGALAAGGQLNGYTWFSIGGIEMSR